ncbi:MNIO family bufferin maturase [Ostreibacterium oceani]|uniref:DUF692 family protein n=1 Tax=Ostreibacterium oceani TaxID=2654998 RepID=A0A6N7ESV7_9GAMM|nr:DUF692 domain-containing protein [Ostreibacterium oceani]MPV85924.1 DUF692 family protein [Ostreibacterium oceani]
MSQEKHNEEKPYLGFGLGLRTEYYETIFEEKPKSIEWFEAISENFMVEGGRPLHNLDKVRQDYPIVLHGVSMSIAGEHEIDYDYLDRLKVLINRVQPAWVSDHLAWTRGSAHNLHDLLPLPYTEESLAHVVERVKRVQDYLGRQILLENPSTYATFTHSCLPEYEYLNALCERSDCLLMLDVNNVFVSAENHGWDAFEYISRINADRVWQHHLAGHTYSYAGKLIVDTHDQPVREEVWNLYAHAVKCLGQVSTIIERDDNMPPLDELVQELDFARSVQADALKKHAAQLV